MIEDSIIISLQYISNDFIILLIPPLLQSNPRGSGLNTTLPLNGTLIVFHVYSQPTGQQPPIICCFVQGQFGGICMNKNDLNNISGKGPMATMNTIRVWSETVSAIFIWLEQLYRACLTDSEGLAVYALLSLVLSYIFSSSRYHISMSFFIV